MILKEKDAYTGGDERGFYGHKQEQDVAFHLRRAFGDSQQVRIIHNPLSCKQCGEAHNLTGMYGQYGYYVKCDSCHTNTSMKQPCPACGWKSVQVAKDGPSYTTTCRKCNHQYLVFRQG